MKRMRRVKILATLGPASQDRAVLARLFEAGADVFRINMSHASHDAMRERVAHDPRARGGLRPADRHPGRPAGAEAARRHLRGRGVELLKGDSFVLDADPAPGDAIRVHLPHPEILRALRPGHAVLIDDGKVKLRMTGGHRDRARSRRWTSPAASRTARA